MTGAGKRVTNSKYGKSRDHERPDKVAGVFIWSKIGGEMFPTSSAGI